MGTGHDEFEGRVAKGWPLEGEISKNGEGVGGERCREGEERVEGHHVVGHHDEVHHGEGYHGEGHHDSVMSPWLVALPRELLHTTCDSKYAAVTCFTCFLLVQKGNY